MLKYNVILYYHLETDNQDSKRLVPTEATEKILVSQLSEWIIVLTENSLH